MKEQKVYLADLLREAEVRVKKESQESGNRFIPIEFPSRVYMLCCEAAQMNRPKLIAELLRSNRLLSSDDREHIADFYEGKFNKLRGRPENYEVQWELEKLAEMVKALKDVAREKGVKLRHQDAIDHVVEKYAGGPDTALAAKLDNYISRSKRIKKERNN